MKSSNIRELSVKDIKLRIVDLKKNLFDLRIQHETGQLENVKKISLIKKDVARFKTVLTNKVGIKD